MAILDAILSTLRDDAEVKEVRAGVFWTAVLSEGCGLASTVIDHGFHHGSMPVREAGNLSRRSARELASLALSGSLVEAAIGVAAMNSLLPVDEDRCVEINAGDVLLQRGRGKRVALVGRFPCVPDLKKVASELWVLERNPGPEDLAANEAPSVIPKADIVAITGSALVNGTLEGLLALCRPSAMVMVLGPSTPLSPVLFDFGVDIVSGTKILDVEATMRRVGEGAAFRQISPGGRLLTMVREANMALAD